MFSWFKKKNELEAFVSQLHKKETYDVDLEMLIRVFALVKKYPLHEYNLAAIRNQRVALYRSRSEFLKCFASCSEWIKKERAPKENINQGVSSNEVSFDKWLVLEDGFRINYYVFIEEFSQMMEDYLQLLLECKAEISRVAFASLEFNLYTLHHDMLSIAENHLAFVYENQPQ